MNRITTCIVSARAAGMLLAGLALTSTGNLSPAHAAYQVLETFTVDPNWDSSNNVSGNNNFGFSNSSNTATASGAGEAGGILSRDPRGYYAANVGSLDPSSDSLSMSGTLFIDIDANDDGESYLGWFDADSLGNDAYPYNFMGLRLINDPPYQTRNFWTVNSANLGQNVAGNFGSNGLADATPFTFSFSYNPNANGGGGRITASSGSGSPVSLDLDFGAKDLFSNFDHFGLISSNYPGSAKSVRIFLDDVSYTTNAVPEPASVALVVCAALATCLVRRRK